MKDLPCIVMAYHATDPVAKGVEAYGIIKSFNAYTVEVKVRQRSHHARFCLLSMRPCTDIRPSCP